MHPSSLDNMRRCIDWFLPDGPVRAVDIGAVDVNGSYRSLMPARVQYTGVDLEAGPGVDVVLEDPYHLPFADGSVDLVLSGQMLEHCAQFWRVFTEIARVLAPGGLVFMIAPSSGPVHRYPVDCWRFYPDSYAALAEWAGLRLVQSWTDARGPWHDLVGVFQKGGTQAALTAPPARARAVVAPVSIAPHADPAAETMRGQRPYREVLADLHRMLAPARYLEIGVRQGGSLALAQGPTVAIDPDPDLAEVPPHVVLHRCTSDDFFFFNMPGTAPEDPFDLAFIDGMHLAEYVFRDFIHVEQRMRPGGVIVIDDVFPNHPLQAARNRQTRVWTGDVWRFAQMLVRQRPDLQLSFLDTAPSGMLMITGVAPKSRVLWEIFDPLARQLMTTAQEPPPAAVLERHGALSPDVATLATLLGSRVRGAAR